MLKKQFPSSLSPAVAFKVMILFCVNVKGYPVKAYLGESKPLSLENINKDNEAIYFRFAKKKKTL